MYYTLRCQLMTYKIIPPGEPIQATFKFTLAPSF